MGNKTQYYGYILIPEEQGLLSPLKRQLNNSGKFMRILRNFFQRRLKILKFNFLCTALYKIKQKEEHNEKADAIFIFIRDDFDC